VGFRKSAVCPAGFWPNPQVHSNVANCKGVGYDGMRQRKLVSFQYKLSVTSQNAILARASFTCLLNKSKRCEYSKTLSLLILCNLHLIYPKFTLIFLRYLFACDLAFTFCDFDTVAFLIISTVATHHRLTLIS